MAKYLCKHCGKIVDRDSKKAWVKSHCVSSGEKLVHLMRVRKVVRK